MFQRIVTVVIVLVSCAPVAWADDAGELEKLRAENAMLRAKVAELEARLGQTTEALEDTKAKVAVVEAERNALATAKAEAERQRREYFVEREYDAGADKTKIMSRVSKLKVTRGAKYRHWFNLYAEHSGKAAGPGASAKSITLVVQTSFSGTQYRGLDAVTLTVDGEPIVLEVSDYDNVFRSSGSSRNRTRKDDETLVIAVPIEAARRIAKATTVTGKLKHNDIVLERQHVEAFAAVLDELKAE